MEVTFGYDVVGTHYVTIDLSEEELQEINWDEMTKEEKSDYLLEKYEYEAMRQAESECDFSIGPLDCIEFDGEEHWTH